MWSLKPGFIELCASSCLDSWASIYSYLYNKHSYTAVVNTHPRHVSSVPTLSPDLLSSLTMLKHSGTLMSLVSRADPTCQMIVKVSKQFQHWYKAITADIWNIMMFFLTSISLPTMPTKRLQGVSGFDASWIRSFNPTNPPTYSLPEKVFLYSAFIMSSFGLLSSP